MTDRFHYLDRVEQCLIDWASYMRQASEVRGFPKSIPGLQNGGASQSFNELCDAVDRRVALATDAAINDLPPDQACAIHCMYLGAKYRFDHLTFELVLAQARDGVAAGLRKRHIWLGE